MPPTGALDVFGGAINNGAMAEHVPRPPFSLDLLIAEAKRRARQRRTLIVLAALFLAALAAGLAFAFGSFGGGSPNGSGPASALQHATTDQGGHQATGQRDHEQELRQRFLAAARRHRAQELTTEIHVRLEARARLRAALAAK